LALASCQTLDGVTVNGVDVNKEYEVQSAQIGNVCANTGNGGGAWVCVLGAVLVGLGIAWAAGWLDGDDDNNNNSSGY
jgi:hypothetical protein